MLFHLVFVGVKALSCFQVNRNTVPNIWCQIRKCFLSVFCLTEGERGEDGNTKI